LNGAAPLGTGTLSSTGIATLATTTLPTGTNSITASYPGDTHYGAANSTATTLTVTKAAQTITFTAPTTPVTYGVSPIALIASGGASGQPVTFSSTGPATVNNSTLTISGAGSVVVTANQAGNSNYSAATAVSKTITVNKATPKATLTSSETSGAYGASVTLTATLSNAGSGSAEPTGTVTFLNGTTSIGTGAPNASGVAALQLATLPVGTDSITASYGGDSDYTSAKSSAVNVKVTKGTQTINFTAPASPVTYGVTPITLLATATSGLGVTFTVSGPATVNGSTLTITGAGSVVVTANQAGNTNYAAAPAVSQTIVVSTGTATVKATSSAASVTHGTSVTLTATLTGSGSVKPTGTITFLNGAASLGTATLNASGVATLALTTLPIGTDSITASFPGDTHYGAATSAAVTVTVK
jgi:hypothetical protein